MHVNLFQRVRILLEGWVHFQNHMVLIQLRENRGDLALAKSVVQRVVDRLRQNTQARCCVTIDGNRRLQSAILLVGGDGGQLGQRGQLGEQLGSPVRQFFSVRVFHRVLELRAADPVFHGQILHWLHEERNTFNVVQPGLQPANNRWSVIGSLFTRLQVNLYAPAIG